MHTNYRFPRVNRFMWLCGSTLHVQQAHVRHCHIVEHGNGEAR